MKEKIEEGTKQNEFESKNERVKGFVDVLAPDLLDNSFLDKIQKTKDDVKTEELVLKTLISKEEKERAKESIREYLIKAGIKDPPEVNLHVVFGAHGSAEDLKMSESQLKSFDIVIPEISGWNHSRLELYRDNALGSITSDEAVNLMDGCFDEYGEELLSLLHDSQKFLIVVDLPADHKIYNALAYMVDRELPVLFEKVVSGDGSLDDFVFEWSKYAKKFIALNKAREVYILSQLGPKIKELIGEHKELKDKKYLKVVMFLGALHTSIYHELKKRGDKATREHSSSIQGISTFSSSDEVFRRYGFDKEVSSELLARQIFIMFLGNERPYLFSGFDDTYKKTRFLRWLSEQFTLEEIKEIFAKRGDKGFDTFLDGVLKSKKVI